MQQGGYLWNKAAITAESAPDDETLGEFGAVRNVNRRERKLEENFQEGLEGTTIVAPRLHYVYSESNLGKKRSWLHSIMENAKSVGNKFSAAMESHTLKLVIFSQPMLFRIDTNIAFQKVGILFVYVRTVLLNLSTERRICLSLFR